MIRLLSRKEIDDRQWDDCISKSPEGQVFFYSWYLDACCQDWSALVFRQYEAVFPIASKSKLGIKYLYQPFFTRHFGAVGRNGCDDVLRKEFLNAIPDDYIYIDFCLHKLHSSVPEKFKSEAKTYQELSLFSEYSEIKNGYNENLIRNLKKAKKMRFQIRENLNPVLLVDCFRKYQNESKMKFRESDYETLKNLMLTARENSESYCISVNDESDGIEAGAFFIRSGNRLLYLKGFSSPTGKKSGAMHLLFDSVIQKFSGQNLLLDFGGSSVQSVARFYHNFGSADCIYLRILANRLPKGFRWLKQ